MPSQNMWLKRTNFRYSKVESNGSYSISSLLSFPKIMIKKSFDEVIWKDTFWPGRYLFPSSTSPGWNNPLKGSWHPVDNCLYNIILYAALYHPCPRCISSEPLGLGGTNFISFIIIPTFQSIQNMQTRNRPSSIHFHSFQEYIFLLHWAYLNDTVLCRFGERVGLYCKN